MWFGRHRPLAVPSSPTVLAFCFSLEFLLSFCLSAPFLVFLLTWQTPTSGRLSSYRESEYYIFLYKYIFIWETVDHWLVCFSFFFSFIWPLMCFTQKIFTDSFFAACEQVIIKTKQVLFFLMWIWLNCYVQGRATWEKWGRRNKASPFL